jgi:2-polyprenyl-3-methyl-5-hydroxy-6-metoxy-1,4-benzoquinol methylase
MEHKFSAHNIVLDNGQKTIPENTMVMPDYPWFKAAKRVIETVFPGDKSNLSIMDLGCYEGGYSVEFARMGLKALGIDVRQSNITLCNQVKKNVALDNLQFIRDDAWNAEDYGVFDIVFCCGLLYHIDQPIKFMRMLSRVAKKVLILQTHYAAELPNPKFALSGPLVLNENATGRWYTEFPSEAAYQVREDNRGAS